MGDDCICDLSTLGWRRGFHRTPLRVGLVGLLLGLFSCSGPIDTSDLSTSCQVSPEGDVVASVLQVVGHDPVWLNVAAGRSDEPQDRLLHLVTARDHPGDLLVKATNGKATALFPQRHPDAPWTRDLTVSNADRPSILPGGADEQLLSRFAFHIVAAHFPEPGCWVFGLTLRNERHEITVMVDLQDG